MSGLVMYVCVSVLVCSSLGSGSGYGWWGLGSGVGMCRRVLLGMYGKCDVV